MKISNYRAGNLTIEGTPFFGKDVAIKALSEREKKKEKFISEYEVLNEGLKFFLDS